MLCHSVRSCCAPETLSFHDSLVAILMFVTVIPLGMERVSGSAPRLPTKMTLFTPRAMSYPWKQFDGKHCTRGGSPQYRVSPPQLCRYTPKSADAEQPISSRRGG